MRGSQHFLRGSDEPLADIPLSSVIEQLAAMGTMGLTTSALSSPSVMIQDGLGLCEPSPGVREVLCASGLFILLAPGTYASVERAGGRRLHFMATVEGDIKSSPFSSFKQMGVSAEPSNIDPRAAIWLREGARGASSESLCMLFFGLPRSAGSRHPCDPADLRRCVAFLEATGTSSRIGEAARLSPEWSALCERWDEIVDLLSVEMRTGNQAPLCYRAMDDIFKSIKPTARSIQEPFKVRP